MGIGLESFRAWRRQAKPAPEPVRIFSRADEPAPRVASGYLPLYKYLEHRYATTVVLSIQQIETLLGFSLPESATREPEWWTGAVPHSSAWRSAGRTAIPNLAARIVTFERDA